MTKLHIGLIGCGRWGRFILRNLLSLRCEVTVVVNGSDQSRQNARIGGATGSWSLSANFHAPTV